MSWFSPARYVSSVERIDLDALWASGKRAILLDRDNTLVPRDRKDAPASVAAWLDLSLIHICRQQRVECRDRFC